MILALRQYANTCNKLLRLQYYFYNHIGVDGNGMSSLSDTIAYVAGAVAVLIVLIIAVAVSTTIIITCILRNRRAELKLKQKNRYILNLNCHV